MATKKTDFESFEEKKPEKAPELTPEQYMNELVPFRAFRDNDKYKDDITVGVNGKIYKIQRGKDIMIPRKVYLVIMRGVAQDEHTADMIAQEESRYDAMSRGRIL